MPNDSVGNWIVRETVRVQSDRPLGGPMRPCADFAISGLNTGEGHRGTLSSSPAFPRYRHFFERNSPDSARLNHYVWI